MHSTRGLQHAIYLIGLMYTLIGLMPGYFAKLKYEEIGGSATSVMAVKGVEDAPLKDFDDWRLLHRSKWNYRKSDAFIRSHQRHARAVSNTSSTPTVPPTTSTAKPPTTSTAKPPTTSTAKPPTTSTGQPSTSAMVPSTTNSTMPHNKTEISDHKYYKSKFIQNSNDFEDLKDLYESKSPFVIMKNLTNSDPSSIRFTEQQLKFKFQFYGHEVERVIVTAAGFIHIGPMFHRFTHDVHYVAPLMADFYSTPNRPIIVFIYDDGQKFTAQWESLYEGGTTGKKSFTFQATLYINGTIKFAYKTIPYAIADFKSKGFPAKVGASDGFVITEYYIIFINGIPVKVPIRTVYRYHTVSLGKESIKSNSTYVLSPIPNCIQANSCETCFNDVIAANFKCKWCSKLNLCSDKFDWHRQKWTDNGCDKHALDTKEKCNILPPTTKMVTNSGKNNKMIKSGKERSRGGTGVIIGIFVAIIVICIAGILIYGYRNPTSKIGLLMIQYRPSKLFGRFRR